MNINPNVIHDGKTHQSIEVNPDVPHDILTWYIVWLVETMGKDAAAQWLGVQR